MLKSYSDHLSLFWRRSYLLQLSNTLR